MSPDHASTCSSWSPPPVWCTRPQHSREFDDGSPQSLRTPCHSSYCCPLVWPVRHPPATSLEPAASVLAESGLTCAAVSVYRSTAHPTGFSDASVLASAASAHSYPGIASWVRPTDLCDRLAGPSTRTCGARMCPAQNEARGMTDLAPPHRPTHTHARRME